LGLRFLRHIERNSLLLFMVPGDTEDIRHEYEVLLGELRQFNPELLQKQRVLAITKCDLLDEELIDMLREEVAPLSSPEGDTLLFCTIVVASVSG
jgi:GTP-binding protein